MWVQALSLEDPLEKEMATHSSGLAWKIPWTEGPGRLQSMGPRRARHNWACVSTHASVIIRAKGLPWTALFLPHPN